MSGRKLGVVVALLIAVIPIAYGAGGCLGDSGAKPVYSVYVVPQRGVLDTFRSWSRLLVRLGQERQLCFDLHISDTFAAFERAVIDGVPDFVYLNPYHQVVARRSAGYIPLVRDGAYRLQGVLVVRRDSGYNDLHDLEGKTIAFPAPHAFAASLLLRHDLEHQGVHFTPKYVGSHGNAYRAVAVGSVAAGGGANTTYSREPAALRQELTVLYRTPPSMPHPLSAHPRIAPGVREAVIEGMLTLAESPQTRKLLDAVQIPQPVRADYARDYGPIEALGLEHLVKVGGD